MHPYPANPVCGKILHHPDFRALPTRCSGRFAVRAISPFAIPAALLLPSPGKKGRRDHPRTAIGGALFHPFRIDKDRAS
jgi:hypothetical protein